MLNLPRLSQAHNCKKLIAASWAALVLGLAASAPARADSIDDKILQLSGQENIVSKQYDGVCDNLRGALAQDFRNKIQPFVHRFKTLHLDSKERIAWRGHVYEVNLVQSKDGQNGKSLASLQEYHELKKVMQDISLRDAINQQMSDRCRIHDNTPEGIYSLLQGSEVNETILDDYHLAQSLMGGVQQASETSLIAASAVNGSHPGMVGKQHKPVNLQALGQNNVSNAQYIPANGNAAQ
jgi:hypothetical protein